MLDEIEIRTWSLGSHSSAVGVFKNQRKTKKTEETTDGFQIIK